MRALLTALIVCLAGGSAFAESVPITVRYSGPPVDEITASTKGETFNLSKDADSKKWRGNIDYKGRPEGYFIPVDLMAYSSDDVIGHLPLRLTRNIELPEISIAIDAGPSCTDQYVARLETPAGDLPTKIKRYLIARAMVTTRQCGPYMTKRLVKAWFDRSVALALLDYFRLDEEARIECVKVKGAAYVKNYVDEIAANNLRILNDRKKTLAAAGMFETALEVNSAILQTLEGNKEAADIFAAKQKMTIGQLKLDQTFLEMF